MGAYSLRCAQESGNRGVRRYRFGALILTLAITGCLGDFLTTPDRAGIRTTTLKRLVVTPEVASLDALGGTTTFTAGWLQSGVMTPAGRCEWTAANTIVASVDDDGTVKANGNGETEIRATCGDSTASASIGVRQAVASVAVLPDELGLDMGESRTVRAIPRDANGNPVERPADYAWASSNGFVVGVSPNADSPEVARVTRYFPGAVNVRVTVEGKSALIRVD